MVCVWCVCGVYVVCEGVCVSVKLYVFRCIVLLTGLWAPIGVIRSYSSRPFLCTLELAIGVLVSP